MKIDSNAKIYHYSDNKYTNILTLNQQPNAKRDPNRHPDYGDHVSFFIDPLPTDLITEIFDEGWSYHQLKGGTRLHEHVVDPTQIDMIKFHLVENYHFDFLFDVIDSADSLNDKYIKNSSLGKLIKKADDRLSKQRIIVGTEMSELVKYLRKYKGITRKGYERVKKMKKDRPEEFERIKNKYAADVPHLMIYTKSPIPVQSHRLVVLGKSNPNEEKKTIRW